METKENCLGCNMRDLEFRMKYIILSLQQIQESIKIATEVAREIDDSL